MVIILGPRFYDGKDCTHYNHHDNGTVAIDRMCDNQCDTIHNSIA